MGCSQHELRSIIPQKCASLSVKPLSLKESMLHFGNGYSIEPCNEGLLSSRSNILQRPCWGSPKVDVTSTPVFHELYTPKSPSSHFINRNHKIKNDDFKENFRQNPFKEKPMEPKTLEFSINDFHYFPFVSRTDSKTTFRFPMTFQKTSPLAGGRQGRTTLVSPLATKTSNFLRIPVGFRQKVGG